VDNCNGTMMSLAVLALV